MVHSWTPGGIGLLPHGLCFSMTALDDFVLGLAPLEDKILGRFSPCALDAPILGSGQRWSPSPRPLLLHSCLGRSYPRPCSPRCTNRGSLLRGFFPCVLDDPILGSGLGLFFLRPSHSFLAFLGGCVGGGGGALPWSLLLLGWGAWGVFLVSASPVLGVPCASMSPVLLG